MSIFKKIEVGMFVIFKVRFWNFGQVLLKTVGKIISIPDQKSAIVVTIDGKYYTTFHIVKIVPEAVPLYAINDMVHTKRAAVTTINGKYYTRFHIDSIAESVPPHEINDMAHAKIAKRVSGKIVGVSVFGKTVTYTVEDICGFKNDTIYIFDTISDKISPLHCISNIKVTVGGKTYMGKNVKTITFGDLAGYHISKIQYSITESDIIPTKSPKKLNWFKRLLKQKE